MWAGIFFTAIVAFIIGHLVGWIQGQKHGYEKKEIEIADEKAREEHRELEETE